MTKITGAWFFIVATLWSATVASADDRMPDTIPMAEITNSATLNRDIGSPPPFIASDYTKYFETGNNTLAFEMQIHTKSGAVMTCDREDDAALFPVTPYTVWMLRNYLLKAVNHKTARDATNPGDEGFGPVAPAILRPWSTNVHGVVRKAGCESGWVIFRGLPPGTYIALGYVGINRSRGGSPGATRTVLGATYDPMTGLMQPSYHQELDYGSSYDSDEGRFVMVSEQYTFSGNKAQNAVDHKFYVFGPTLEAF